MTEKGQIMHDKRKNPRNNDLTGVNWGTPEGDAVSVLLVASVTLRMVQIQWSDCDYDKRNITVVICDTDIP